MKKLETPIKQEIEEQLAVFAERRKSLLWLMVVTKGIGAVLQSEDGLEINADFLKNLHEIEAHQLAEAASRFESAGTRCERYWPPTPKGRPIEQRQPNPPDPAAFSGRPRQRAGR